MANLSQYDKYNNDIGVQKNKKTSFLREIGINEWIFSICLFLMSSAIVLGKIYFFYDVPLLPNDVISHTSEIIQNYRWFLKAVCSGLGVTAFTWFIIYKDSQIPGINPPSPFSPSKKKFSHDEELKVPLNYLIGVLNGILTFIYMCL